jgi:hypothetical protein
MGSCTHTETAKGLGQEARSGWGAGGAMMGGEAGADEAVATAELAGHSWARDDASRSFFHSGVAKSADRLLRLQIFYLLVAAQASSPTSASRQGCPLFDCIKPFQMP